MKILIFFATLVSFAQISMAKPVNLDQGDLGLSAIAADSTKLSFQRFPCGPSCTAAVTYLNLNYNLGGCLDRLVSFHSIEEDKVNHEVTVYVTALNVHTAASTQAKCFVMPTASEKIQLPGFFSDHEVNVVFVGVD